MERPKIIVTSAFGESKSKIPYRTLDPDRYPHICFDDPERYSYITADDWTFYNLTMFGPGRHFLPDWWTTQFIMDRLRRFRLLREDLIRDGKMIDRVAYWIAALHSELVVRGLKPSKRIRMRLKLSKYGWTIVPESALLS